jgi:3-oxoacyl-(acyl-carrier-protein) synthase
MSSPSIILAGAGAVSSAGWGTESLFNAIQESRNLPTELSQREGSPSHVQIRRVPKPDTPLAFMRNPRLRRSSPISRYAVAAALEALGEERHAQVIDSTYRLGVLFVFMNGCVNYSNRFYGEVLNDPSLASPILFPETVFNAPASHLAAMLESRGPAYTLIGDSAQFLGGMDLGIEWLLDNQVDGVLVVGSEELDWLSTEAASLFSSNIIVSEGAGAVLLEATVNETNFPKICGITPAFSYGNDRSRSQATAQLMEALPTAEGLQVQYGLDNDLLDISSILGNALGAGLALQCTYTQTALANQNVSSAQVIHVGSNQQAIGAWFRA